MADVKWHKQYMKMAKNGIQYFRHMVNRNALNVDARYVFYKFYTFLLLLDAALCLYVNFNQILIQKFL